MTRTFLNFGAIALLTFISSCSTVKVAERPYVNKSIDVVLFHNIVLKAPDFDGSVLAYNTFYDAMLELKSRNINFNDPCGIKTSDIEIWKSANEYAKKNIPLLNFNDKDFKILNVEASETEYSKVFSVASEDKNIFCPFIHLEVEYTDRSVGTINVVFYKGKISYMEYTEVLPDTGMHLKKHNHQLLVRIDYFPNGNVKSYYTKSSLLNSKVGKYCEYSENGSVLRNIDIERLFSLSVDNALSVVYKYQNIKIDSSQSEKYAQLDYKNQEIAFPVQKVNRYLNTNYGKVWIVKKMNDVFLVDDSNSTVISKDNFVELSSQEYEKEYRNIDFKELEQQLGKKVLIINKSDDFGIN